jgi:F-type H+-transporting ATPase subunit epsilon
MALQLEIVTPEKIVVSREVDMVVAPGSLGEFGVLEGHIPFLSGILPGELRFNAGGKTEYLAVSTGFAEVLDNRVSVLVDSAELARDIDLDRARQSMERARERLAQDRKKADIDFLRAEAALRRAVSRLKVAEKVQ